MLAPARNPWQRRALYPSREAFFWRKQKTRTLNEKKTKKKFACWPLIFQTFFESDVSIFGARGGEAQQATMGDEAQPKTPRPPKNIYDPPIEYTKPEWLRINSE